MPGTPEPRAEGANKDPSNNEPEHTQPSTAPVSTSAGLEMDDLSTSAAAPAAIGAAASSSDKHHDKDHQDSHNAKDTTSGDDHDNEDLSIRPANGPSETADAELAVDIMLLLTTGARHPFRIDDKYLARRNVSTTGTTSDGKIDPFTITVYTLKELILRDWRKEWDQPPREPSAIRLIHFGRMLEDRMPLNHYQFSTATRNVVHMTVKPQEIIDEEEAAKKVKDSDHRSTRGGCCVIL